MTSESGCSPLFINTILFGGTPEQKIAAARTGGFDQIELWRHDVEGYSGDAETFGREIRRQSLGLTDYQAIQDFDGAPDDLREGKQAAALKMLNTAVEVGAKTVLTTASTDPRCIAGRIDEDMLWLVQEAAARKLRIVYENLAWSTVNFTVAAASALVERLNEPNLGLVADSFHIFARKGDASDLAGIPVDRIWLVQLSDFDPAKLPDPNDDNYREDIKNIARHHRLLPGQGRFPIASILEPLRKAGYSGPVGIEVFSDYLKARDPELVAQEAMSALREVWDW